MRVESIGEDNAPSGSTQGIFRYLGNCIVIAEAADSHGSSASARSDPTRAAGATDPGRGAAGAGKAYARWLIRSPSPSVRLGGISGVPEDEIRLGGDGLI